MDFYCRLVPPRPSFATDMTAQEAALMKAHGLYWREGLERGEVLAFGLVMDPDAPFGMGLVRFPDMAEARAFTDGDPTIRSGLGFRFDVHPMPNGVVTAT